jgi:pimeloyl-ACP methyl ester carboxylesterase
LYDDGTQASRSQPRDALNANALDAFPALRAWRDGGEWIVIGGHRIFVRRGGSGPPLLLIHGFPTSSLDWAPIWPALCARFEVAAFDLLGFGLSSKPRGHRYTLAEQADIAITVARYCRWHTFFVLAHDYGDTVAQELLARQIEQGGYTFPALLRLCFLNGGLFPETHRARPIQRLLASPLGPWLIGAMRKPSFSRNLNGLLARPLSEHDIDMHWALLQHDDGVRAVPSLLGYMRERRERRARWVGALQAPDTRAGTIPLRLICGALDPVSGLHLAERYRALVPNPDVMLLEDVGHYPQLEAPERVADAAIAFFSEPTTQPQA